MPYVKVKKKRKKSLSSRFKEAMGKQSAASYVSLAVAFLLALYVGRYLLRYLTNTK